MIRAALTGAFVASQLLAASALAQMVDTGAVRDACLYEDPLGSLANGDGDHFFAGRTGQPAGADQRRGVIEFNVAGAVPAGSTITSVTLRLSMSRAQPFTHPVSLHRLTAGWGEGISHAGGEEGAGAPSTIDDVTWMHTFYPGDFWTTPGGDYTAAPSATIQIGNVGSYMWSSPGMIADVQAWLDEPSSNHGWILIGNEQSPTSSKRFDSRNHPIAGVRPRLTIGYAAGPVDGGCCFDDGTCAVLESSACTGRGGLWQGPEVTCPPNPCPQPTGACCFGTGACSTLLQSACINVDGTWQGPNTVCSPNPCCPADTNGDGTIDVDDLVAIIVAWGTNDPAADIDGSGSVDVDDLVAVIVAWGPC